MEFKQFVRDVPDFPRVGILFKDITPLLDNALAFMLAIDAMAEPVLTLQPTHVLGLESRGFIFGSALAHKLSLGFVPARKPGKLPMPTFFANYASEYGESSLHIHQDALKEGNRVLIVDDVLATGETAGAARCVIEQAGAHPVALTLLIELGFLKGREHLKGLPVFSVLVY
jgi:adenine phosphoribosyltransferase